MSAETFVIVARRARCGSGRGGRSRRRPPGAADPGRKRDDGPHADRERSGRAVLRPSPDRHGVIATATRPARRRPGQRTLSTPHEPGDDLRDRLGSGGPIVIIGAGWIGIEAAAARAHGCDVTLVDPQPTPLHAVVGAQVGQYFRDLHTAHGVSFRMGTGVERLIGQQNGDAAGVMTTAGEHLMAATVLVGSVPRPTRSSPRTPASRSTTASWVTSRCTPPRPTCSR